jgi:hypothetical protein
MKPLVSGLMLTACALPAGMAARSNIHPRRAAV